MAFLLVLSSILFVLITVPSNDGRSLKNPMKYQPFKTNPDPNSGVPIYFDGPVPFSSDDQPTLDGLPRTSRSFMQQRSHFLAANNHLVIDDDGGNSDSDSIPPDVDSDSRLQVCSIAKLRGYPCETHYTVTTDGYVLTVFRISHGKKSSPKAPLPVLVHHGLLDTGFTWVSNFEYESLAFLLADAGHDVWIANTRGNLYSRAHTSLSPSDRRFWLWSFDEIAAFDLPAYFNLVLTRTNQSKLNYIGHSQGTMVAFAGFSTSASLASKVNLFVALCPIARVTHIRGAVRSLLPLADSMFGMLETLSTGEFLPDSKVTKYLARDICGTSEFMDQVCADVYFTFEGWGNINLNVTRIPVYIAHFPAGTSAMNVYHFAQVIRADRFQKMDYGTAVNLVKYGTVQPSEYDLTGFPVKTALLWSANDQLATIQDITWLISQLPKANVVFNKRYDRYGHGGFVWSPFAREDIYPDILQLLKT